MPRVASADGTGIAYEVRGDGPPLVLLHGDLTRRFWDPVVPRLADEYTVVLPDRRGRGDSEDGEAHSLDREVADARVVIDAVDGDPVVFGHSFGGLQALEAAREGGVAAVVAYEPAVIVGEYRETADLADRMADLIEAGDRREAVKRHVDEVLHGGALDDDELEAWLEEWPPWPEYVRFAENLLRTDRAVERYDLPEALGVDAPALLLTGAESPSHLRDGVRAVHEALPESRLVEFEDLGHGGPVEAPARVTEAVRSFLQRVGAAP